MTPYKGGWCGNDVSPTILPAGVPDKVREMARKFGDRLYAEGYKGVFCVDFLLDTDTNEVYLGELNPRVSGATPPTNLITTTYGGCPLFLFHLMEFSGIRYKIDVEELNERWAQKEFIDSWSQVVMKYTDKNVDVVTNAPPTGVYKMSDDGNVNQAGTRPEHAKRGRHLRVQHRGVREQPGCQHARQRQSRAPRPAQFEQPPHSIHEPGTERRR